MSQSMIYFFVGLAVLLVAAFMVGQRYRREHPEEGMTQWLDSHLTPHRASNTRLSIGCAAEERAETLALAQEASPESRNYRYCDASMISMYGAVGLLNNS